MLFPSPSPSFHFFSKKREIQKQGQVFSLLFLGEEIRNILVQEKHAAFEWQSLSDAFRELVCCLFPSGPTFILATILHSAFYLWQCPSLVCRELVCCVSLPHLGDLNPPPVPHFEHKDSFHPKELSWRWQASQHKEHMDLHTGTVIPNIWLLW